MKKIIALSLSMLMLFSSMLPTYASDFDQNNTYNQKTSSLYYEEMDSKDFIYVSQNEQGYYITSYNADVAQKAYQTIDAGIYMLDDGTLLSETEINTYQVVQKITVNLFDEANVSKIVSNSRISEFVRESIAKQSSNAIEVENEDAVAVIFVPYQSLARASERFTYKYSGYNMMDEIVYYYNVSTGYVEISKGTDAGSIAKNLFDIGITVGSEFSKYIGVVGWASSGVSAFQGFIDATGRTPISGSHSDKLQLKINYDYKEKMTYVYENGWKTGCRSKQVKILNTVLYQYYFNTNGGRELETYTTHNLTLQTSNYLSPASKAIQWRDNCWTEDITGQIYNHMVYFE